MKEYFLHQKVRDGYTGRVGEIIKVVMQDYQRVYTVKFKNYTADLYAEEIREVK